MDIKDLLNCHPELIIKENEPLGKYTHTKTGGLAEILFLPKSIEEVISIIKWTKFYKYPVTVLGNGSNLIVRDGGIQGVTMILTKFNSIIRDGYSIIADSGALLADVSITAYKNKLTGVEFACGIPGSVGGAVYMNAGAYGGEVKDIIESVTLLTRDGDILEVNNNFFHFSYRFSNLMNNNLIVLRVKFNLEKGNIIKIKTKMMKLTYLRKSKQPLEYPSCGSVFKDPLGYSPAKLIIESGLKGFKIGGAQISKKHPNFIVNVNSATATDYIELINYIQKVVYEKKSVKLQNEVRIIGKK